MFCKENDLFTKYSWFVYVWNENFPTLATIDDDIVRCSTCVNINEQLKSDKISTEKKIELQEELNHHKKISKIQRNYEFTLKGKNFSINSGLAQQDKITLINLDHMSSKNVIKKKYKIKNDITKEQLKIHIGGLYDYKTNYTHYFLYPENHSENSNVIITQIHEYLNTNYSTIKSSNIKKLVVLLDNHSTNKSYLVLLYLYLLVVYFKCFEEVELGFLIPGHTHSIIDQRHSIIRKKIISVNDLFSIEDWKNMINNIKKFTCILGTILDFNNLLNEFINKNEKFKLNTPYIFNLTKDGIRTKYIDGDDYGKWRNENIDIEPYNIFKGSFDEIKINEILFEKPKEIAKIDDIKKDLDINSLNTSGKLFFESIFNKSYDELLQKNYKLSFNYLQLNEEIKLDDDIEQILDFKTNYSNNDVIKKYKIKTKNNEIIWKSENEINPKNEKFLLFKSTNKRKLKKINDPEKIKKKKTN
jgi:hypothetical protein